MKAVKTLCVASVLFAGVAECATIERTLVRQMWPWNGEIRVEYRISDVTDPVDVQVEVSGNGQAIDVPASAISGDVFSVTGDGIYAMTLASPTNWVPQAVKDLSVTLTPVTPSSTEANVLYRVYDLVSGACEDITVGSILNGSRGAWHWADPSGERLMPGEANDAAGLNLVWTGFNADIACKTTKLVMRYLPAKDQLVRILNSDNGTIEENFWVAVYETTQAQWKNVHGTTPSFATVGDMKPASNVKFDDIRGAKGPEDEEAKYYWPNDPDPESFLGKLRELTGAAFDLPREAYWEYAGQVNSDWRLCSDYTGKRTYNTGKSFGTENGALGYANESGTKVSWPSDPNFPGTYKGNASAYADVGSFAPSKVGLYDFHGNVKELCVDWSNGYVQQLQQKGLGGKANVNLEDPTQMLDWNKATYPDKGAGTARMTIGSTWSTALADQTPNYTRGSLSPSSADNTVGFRVIIAEKND